MVDIPPRISEITIQGIVTGIKGDIAMDDIKIVLGRCQERGGQTNNH